MATTADLEEVTQGQIVSIATWILLVASSLAMIARLATKWAVSRRFQVDDGMAIMALLCHIGSGGAVTALDNNGLGQSIGTLSNAQKHIFSQSAYAADLLFICTLVFAKLSIALFFPLISRVKTHHMISYGCAGVITLWGVASFLGAAFLCSFPEPWNVFGKCHNRATFWYTFSVINALTDTALIVIPTFIIIPLHMSLAKKFMVLSCFGTRICDIGVTIAQIAFTNAFSDANFTQTLWPWVLCSQFIQCISIITSCIPYLKPLLDAFPSGMFMSDEIRRKASNTQYSADGYIRTPEQSSRSRSVEPAVALNKVDTLKSSGSDMMHGARSPGTTLSSVRHHPEDDDEECYWALNRAHASSPSPDRGIMKTTTTIVTSR